MSAHLIPVAATIVLQQELHQAQARFLPAGIPACPVVPLPPDRIEAGDAPVLGLALLRIRRDPAFRHRELPRGGPPGQASLHLLLHYMVSLRGGQALEAELVLGCVQRQVQDQAMIMSDQIAAALADGGGRPDIAEALRQADMAAALLPIRLALEVPAASEEAVLWQALRQPLRPALFLTAAVAALA